MDGDGGRRALVVGTAAYADPALGRLRAPAQDAAAVAAVLGDPAVGGFAVDQVLDQPDHELRVAVESFLVDAAVEDTVVLYLSCHGLLDVRGRLYFAASNTRKRLLASTAVEAGWLVDRLDECPARRQVLILDCCFSGAFSASAKGAPEIDLERRMLGGGRGRAVLTASRAGEYSFEGRPLAGPHQSVFTAALVDGLRTGAADVARTGVVTVEDAFDHAAAWMLARRAEQTPQRWLYGGEGKIVLARNPRGRAVVPAAIPEALRVGLESPYPDLRLAAARTLGSWLTSADDGERLTARQTLTAVADQDIPKVAAAARELLDAHPSPPPTTGGAVVLPRPVAREAATPVPEREQAWQQAAAIQLPDAADIAAFALCPRGRFLAIGGPESPTRLYDRDAGAFVRRGRVVPVASALTFSPGGTLLAAGDAAGKVTICEVATGRALRTFKTGRGAVADLAYNPRGTLLGAACAAGYRVWEAGTGADILVAGRSSSAALQAIAFSPDGRWMAKAGTGVELTEIAGRRTAPRWGGRVAGLAFSPDSTLLAAAGDGGVLLWPVAHPSGDELSGLLGDERAVAFSPDGALLAVGSADGAIRVWEVPGWKPAGVLDGHVGAVSRVAFDLSGNLVSAADGDSRVLVWRAPD
ncbi:caspase, EACC1-associated type [Actinokineospora sp. NPDC004072]